MSEPDYKMLYLGTARLLCEVHTKYVSACNALGEDPSRDVGEMIECFRDDFNDCPFHHEIAHSGPDTYAIFEKETGR